MATPQSFIIVKGQPKALQIEKISIVENGVYAIQFKNSQKIYHYRNSDVVWLKNAVWHDHQNLKVYVEGREQHHVADIQSFQHGVYTHWRITFDNGYARDYMHGSIQVVESCLGDDIAKNVFEYLKRIAQVNELGKDESLIEFVKDRLGHDRRYAIDSTKIQNDLGWKPKYTFETGIRETINWYLDNKDWIDQVKSGNYQKYYEKMYGNR